ncbi:MAG: hypothetical protein ACR5K4_01220 [Sodalis sp. (in: enterobacteria)]
MIAELWMYLSATGFFCAFVLAGKQIFSVISTIVGLAVGEFGEYDNYSENIGFKRVGY